MEAATKRGRPAIISKEDRERLLAAKGLDSERWALDKRFMEAATKALEGETYPFILPPGKKPRSSLLIELGRWGDDLIIQKVAKMIEEAASQNSLTIKEAISKSRDARLQYQKEEAASKKDKPKRSKGKMKKHSGKEEKAINRKLKGAFDHESKVKNAWKAESPPLVDAEYTEPAKPIRELTDQGDIHLHQKRLEGMHQQAAASESRRVKKPSSVPEVAR